MYCPFVNMKNLIPSIGYYLLPEFFRENASWVATHTHTHSILRKASPENNMLQGSLASNFCYILSDSMYCIAWNIVHTGLTPLHAVIHPGSLHGSYYKAVLCTIPEQRIICYFNLFVIHTSIELHTQHHTLSPHLQTLLLCGDRP